jgi:hypothetical protein
MTARRVVVLLVFLFLVYAVVLGVRGVELIQGGKPQFVLLGVGVLILPFVGVAIVWRELRFGTAAQTLARVLEAEGALPVDELPRRESGRVDRKAADVVFEKRKAEVEAAPEDWRAWYRLGVAYGDAGDNARGRRAVKHAIALAESQGVLSSHVGDGA